MNSKEDHKQIIIAPRVLPRDFADLCIAIAVGTLMAAVLFGTPAVIAFIITRSALVACLVYLAALAIALCFMVRRISVSPIGIQFHRLLGSPKFMPWQRIHSVSVVSRRELILRGWLWPLFPPREFTACHSSLLHYRITWDDGFCYYPPADTSFFEQYVSEQLQPANS